MTILNEKGRETKKCANCDYIFPNEEGYKIEFLPELCPECAQKAFVARMGGKVKAREVEEKASEIGWSK